jgi:protein TonB
LRERQDFTPSSPWDRLQVFRRDASTCFHLPAYRLPSPYSRPTLQRRVAGFALALAINVALLLVLMTLGIIPPPSQRTMRGIVVDLIPQQRSSSRTQSQKNAAQRPRVETNKPVPKPLRIVLPVKPTIAPPPQPTEKISPWLEMSKEDMAASDISKLPAAGSGSAGDSEVVGRGPNGEDLYAAQWAREPTDAELGGYLPHNAPDGYGLIACRTIPGNRVDDCIELDQEPRGSHLASAVRQAAWQFRVRPPRKGGRPLVGAWVRIRIDYSFARSITGSE